MMLKVMAMFLGICLAIIHLLVGILNIVFFDGWDILGILFLIGAAGYVVAGFATAFNRIRLGMMFFIIFHFLDFFIMLYFELILEFFSCLLAIIAVFLIIVQIRQDYFAMESTKDEEGGKKKEVKPIMKGSTPDPLGFDQDVYYRKYHNIKLKKIQRHPTAPQTQKTRVSREKKRGRDKKKRDVKENRATDEEND